MGIPKIPPGAEIVRTYRDLDAHVDAFFRGAYNLLVIIGRPGIGKSFGFERRLGRTSHLIRGWTAPLQAYIECFVHRHKRIIFDDAEVLWQKPAGRLLLRALCEHVAAKLLQWLSTTPALAKALVPQRFTTTSKVALIANRFLFGGTEEYAAIADRGHIIYFDPLPLEVHAYVGGWFWDQEIYDYIGERLHLISDLSSRAYRRAAERKGAGGDWRSMIDDVFCRDAKARLVQALETDTTCPTVEDKVLKFIKTTGCCRATYFNIKARLNSNNQLRDTDKIDVPKWKVHGVPPAEPDVDEELAKLADERNAEDQEELSGLNYESSIGTLIPGGSEASPAKGNPQPPQAPPDDDFEAHLQWQLQHALRRQDYRRAATIRDALAKLHKTKPEEGQQNG